MEDDKNVRYTNRENTVEEVWLTEWSTNKIGKIDTKKDLPFKIEISESDKNLTLKEEKQRK